MVHNVARSEEEDAVALRRRERVLQRGQETFNENGRTMTATRFQPFVTITAIAGGFPVRLKPEDWKSGDIVWLLDVIAPMRELATMVLTNFHQVAKQDKIKIHPMVAHLVDPEVLAKLSKIPQASAHGEQRANTLN
jgi:hypothetical protein